MIVQSAAKAAQDSAKAKVDSIVEDVKAAPKNLQKDLTKAGEAAVGQVRSGNQPHTTQNWRCGELLFSWCLFYSLPFCALVASFPVFTFRLFYHYFLLCFVVLRFQDCFCVEAVFCVLTTLFYLCSYWSFLRLGLRGFVCVFFCILTAFLLSVVAFSGLFVCAVEDGAGQGGHRGR